jgi:predicted ArsR family transcriptional regulator
VYRPPAPLMEVPPAPADDVLAVPIRARLFQALGDLRRPGTTQELAALVGRHPNTVRVQLQHLADAGLLERRVARRPRGRPRDEWAVAPQATPAGRPPQAYGQLSRWLARAAAAGGDFEAIERAGREIGREIAPEPGGRGSAVAMQDALAALGFAPRPEPTGPAQLRFVLANCPYRDAVRQNQAAVCTLHRGLTKGLLERIQPSARLADFVAKDPYAAGCLIALDGVSATG